MRDSSSRVRCRARSCVGRSTHGARATPPTRAPTQAGGYRSVRGYPAHHRNGERSPGVPDWRKITTESSSRRSVVSLPRIAATTRYADSSPRRVLVNVLVWHVHGSWTSAFVQVVHRLQRVRCQRRVAVVAEWFGVPRVMATNFGACRQLRPANAPPRERPRLARARLLDHRVRPGPPPLPAAHAARARPVGRRAAGGLGLARLRGRVLARRAGRRGRRRRRAAAPRGDRARRTLAGPATRPRRGGGVPRAQRPARRPGGEQPAPDGRPRRPAARARHALQRPDVGHRDRPRRPSSSTASSTPGTATPASSRRRRCASTSRSGGAG